MDPETRGGRMSSKGEEAVERIRRALPPDRPSDIGQLSLCVPISSFRMNSASE